MKFNSLQIGNHFFLPEIKKKTNIQAAKIIAALISLQVRIRNGTGITKTEIGTRIKIVLKKKKIVATRTGIDTKVIKTNIGRKTGVIETNIDQMMGKRNHHQILLQKTRNTNPRIVTGKEMRKIGTEVIRINTAVIRTDTPVLKINRGKRQIYTFHKI